MTYEIIQVPDLAQQLEQLGTKAKFWFTGADQQQYLFKYCRENTGEDWAEKIASMLCAALGLPHATYELAEFSGKRGVVSPNFYHQNGRLIYGNELLSYVVSEYEMADKYHRVHHTIGRIFALLDKMQVGLPFKWKAPPTIQTANDVFVGYLLLDALVGNQDRHDQNWGILELDGKSYLQPTYDHASSLGRLLSNEKCRDRLISKDKNQWPSKYVEKAKSALYSPRDSKLMGTLEAFESASTRNKEASEYWLGQLNRLEDQQMEDIINEIPHKLMGDSSKEFAFQMLKINKLRLLK